ncbi:MAG: molybdenum cofactor guanylyltransferase [Methylobacteriaceae bacterium]|nr:molybdenum cofactor guanylyltransferase [Methylobacteriaceae bacterium]
MCAIAARAQARMSEAPVCGIILAGGLARRMGGGDKPLKTIAGKPILAHVIERLRPQCARLVLNANGDPARFASFGLPVVADDVPDFAGPLAGILAGLDWIAANVPDCECAISVAGDTPFIPRDLVQRLQMARLNEASDIAVAASGGRTHPVIALWPIALRTELRRALTQESERKIDRFTARYQVAEVSWPNESYDPFFNVNEAGDIEAAEAIAGFAFQ